MLLATSADFHDTVVGAVDAATDVVLSAHLVGFKAPFAEELAHWIRSIACVPQLEQLQNVIFNNFKDVFTDAHVGKDLATVQNELTEKIGSALGESDMLQVTETFLHAHQILLRYQGLVDDLINNLKSRDRCVCRVCGATACESLMNRPPQEKALERVMSLWFEISSALHRKQQGQGAFAELRRQLAVGVMQNIPRAIDFMNRPLAWWPCWMRDMTRECAVAVAHVQDMTAFQQLCAVAFEEASLLPHCPPIPWDLDMMELMAFLLRLARKYAPHLLENVNSKMVRPPLELQTCVRVCSKVSADLVDLLEEQIVEERSRRRGTPFCG